MALMRASRVVVLGVPVQNDPQVAFADDEHPVGAFDTDGLHPALGEGIHLRTLTNAQLIAMEQARLGDLHLELEVEATAP